MTTSALGTDESSDGRRRSHRDLNHRAVYERLATLGSASRSDLATALELSPASVGRVVEQLIHKGLVEEGDRIASGVGRPKTLLHVNARAALVAGVSIRSTSLRLHLADLGDRVLARERIERNDESPAALARQLRDLIRRTRERHAPDLRLASLVVGVSGVWDAGERRIYAAPNLALLEGVDLGALLRDALRGELLADRVDIDNDINLAAIGEREHGAAAGVDDFFYLSLGSGVGGASVVAGTLHRGVRGFAGELGYLPIVRGGETKPLEQLVGRAALERFAERSGIPLPSDDVFAHLERVASADDAVAAYVSDVLGQALVAVVVTLNPERIVLGGGVGRTSVAWTERVRQRLAAFVPVVPDIVSTELGRTASLLGAVALGRVAARRTLLETELGV